jgi:glycosyltransferase involved in cell wall biosynthesis
MAEIRHTIIIPTRNHPELLKRCLEALSKARSTKYGWEVLIMDNSDPSRRGENESVVNSFSDQRFQYVQMQQVGLMFARHQGMELARGGLVSFIDDDSFVSENWLSGIERAFDDPIIGLVTGPIHPLYEMTPPEWLEFLWMENEYGRYLGLLSLLEFGDEPLEIPPEFVWGCNYSIRKDIFFQVKGSHPDYLPEPRKSSQGDGEIGLSIKVESLGFKAFYSPLCAISHWIPQVRLTENYLGERAFFVGLHQSFTEYRREHGLAFMQGVSPRPRNEKSSFFLIQRLRTLAARFKNRPEAQHLPLDLSRIRKWLQKRRLDGWNFHRRALKYDAGLRSYVLRSDFMGTNSDLPEQLPHENHMRKTKQDSIGFQNVRIWLKELLLPIGMVIVLAVLAGLSAGIGKITYVIPILAVMSIPFLLRVDEHTRFLVLMILPFLNLFQMPGLHLPLGIPPILAVMGILMVVELLFQWQHGVRESATSYLFEYLPLVVLTLGGLIAGLRNGELFRWFIFPLPLLIVFFLSRSLVRSKRDANAIILSIFASIIGYFLFIWVMKTFGQVSLVSKYALGWRLFGDGQQFSLGPISYRVWSIEAGAIAGLGTLIAVYFLVSGNRAFLERLGLFSSLGLFAVILVLGGARGATIATCIGVAGLVILTRRGLTRGFVILVLAGFILLVFQDTFLNFIPSEIMQRFMELKGDPSQVTTFQYRMEILVLTLKNFSMHPLGAGYNYMWDAYNLDESIMYSSILNGAGLIGALGFFMWMAQLGWRFVTSLTSSQAGNFPALGFSICMFVCLNGLVSSSVLLDTIISLTIWATLITAYQATYLPNFELDHTTKHE